MTDLSKMDGGTLRRKLEEALAEVQALRTENRDLKVEALLGGSEFNLVTKDDLAGIETDSLDEKAKEVQTARADEQFALLKRAGLDDETAAKVVAGGNAEIAKETAKEDETAKAAAARMKVVAGVSGGERAPAEPESTATGYGKIREALGVNSKTDK